METDEEQYILPFLPDELWEEIFGNLTHTEKLISRLVCSEWNRLISSDLSKHSFFSLTSAPSQQVLIDSSIPWKKISLRYDTHLSLPSIYEDLITTVRVIIPGWSKFKDCLNLLTQLQNLITLDLDLEISDKESEILLIIDHEFIESVRKLTELSIKFAFNNYKGLKKILEYIPDKLCLTKLSVKEHRRHPYKEMGQTQNNTVNNNAEWLNPQLFNIISKCSGTLKFLELGFFSKSVRVNLFSELVQNLCTLQDLKLETVFIRQGGLFNGNVQSDFDIYQNFLRLQIDGGGVMKRLSLPWCSNTILCEEFMRNLPRNIEFIGLVRKEHMSDSMYRNFPKLKSVCFTASSQLTGLNQPCPNIKTISIDFEEGIQDMPIQDQENHMAVFYGTAIGQTLTHLVELHIERGTLGIPSFYDRDLQLIIFYFRQLRVLHIDCDSVISDLGVTGIEQNYIYDLMFARRLYSCREIQKENMVGLPLSSLRSLEKLTLRTLYLTNLGIYYGLRFGSTLKHLFISSTRSVSEWGLEHLGNGNPCLESFKGEFQSRAISMTGHEGLRQRLPMVEYTNKFELIKREPSFGDRND